MCALYLWHTFEASLSPVSLQSFSLPTVNSAFIVAALPPPCVCGPACVCVNNFRLWLYVKSWQSNTQGHTHAHTQTHRDYLLALFAYLWMCSSCSSYVLIALFGWYFKYLTLISNVRIVIVAWGMWHVAMEGMFIHPLGACVCNNFAVQLVLCTNSSGKWLSRGIFLSFFFSTLLRCCFLFALCLLFLWLL